FGQAPEINPNASKITGMICGYRVEEIDDKLVREIRYLDKLIDELAKGKDMEKILRKSKLLLKINLKQSPCFLCNFVGTLIYCEFPRLPPTPCKLNFNSWNTLF